MSYTGPLGAIPCECDECGHALGLAVICFTCMGRFHYDCAIQHEHECLLTQQNEGEENGRIQKS